MTWTLADIRSAVRSYTGRSTTGELSDAAANALINDYYRYDFCQELGLDRFDQAWSQQATVDDDGQYTASEDIVRLEAPVFANDEELVIFLDKESFWQHYPSQEDWQTAPTLSIGTTDAAAVKNAAFRYRVDSWGYYDAGGETALSGDAVPVNTYGAWQLEIDADGTITIQAASANGTGYATAARAVAGLPQRGASRIVMGFVTAINTSGAFTPGTTELSAGGVTATYTDGDPKLRGVPEAILLNRSEAKIYLRPKPNDDYLLKSVASLQRPTALSNDTDTPHDESWGRALALGAAIKYLGMKEADTERMNELTYGTNPLTPTPGSLRYELNRIERKQSLQLSARGVQRAW